jgi:hypothetical protein
VKWVPDSTGRFKWRPYYDQEELNSECEWLVTSFLEQKCGERRFPISTDDLCVMIEQHASDLDLYADLSIEGEDVEGVTEFFPNKKPAIRIAQELSIDSSKSGRLRTTLAHEFGHVKFHSFLWELNPPGQKHAGVLSKIPAQREKLARLRKRITNQYAPEKVFQVRGPASFSPNLTLKSRHGHMLDAPYSDWMEWQASYACGAILMPVSSIQNLVCAQMEEAARWLPCDSDSARELIAHVAARFDVPIDSARIRLEKLGFLQKI